jgi:hypothetical protein
MNKIFLAYSYRDENKRLIADVIDPLVRSHNVLPVAGDILGGEQLTAAVQGLIASSDALVGFMTRDRQIAGGNTYAATQWVQNELVTARTRKQRAIAVVENGVDTSGMFSDNERIDFDRANPLPAVIKLSQTIALWKAEAGRSIEIRILPAAAAKVAVSEQLKCEYRLTPPLGRPGSWIEAYASRKPGGVFLLLQGVKPDEAIEVKISKKDNGSARWTSSQNPQWVHIELERAR